LTPDQNRYDEVGKMKIWILEGGMIGADVVVSLEENRVRIEIVKQLPIFFNNKFAIFADGCGAQYIQKEDNKKYKLVNVIGGRRTEAEISEEEAKRIIRDVIMEKIEDSLGL
jgi:hypothetical protein